MLQVARLSPKLLGDSADRVADFFQRQFNPDGGFCDREGKSDLYYTVFGLEGLLALQAGLPVAAVTCYLQSFGEGDGLDFVHLACLARAWAALPRELQAGAPRVALIERLAEFRSSDGGFHVEPSAASGTVYACFLALGAYQDLGQELPNPDGVLRCMRSLAAGDGGYSNQRDMPQGLTPSTAAAATLLRHLGQPLEAELGQWILSRCHAEGGFFATPSAPMPDLLSTATALHALSGLHVDLEPVKERCLDFLDSLWTSQGGFYGTWADDQVDCEYTYYALLALGHLSL